MKTIYFSIVFPVVLIVEIIFIFYVWDTLSYASQIGMVLILFISIVVSNFVRNKVQVDETVREPARSPEEAFERAFSRFSDASSAPLDKK